MGFVFGGKGGGGGASQANASDSLTAQQAELARKLWDQTDPNRMAALGQLGGVLQGQSPLAQQMFAPTRDLFEKQFSATRENILSNSPARGGQMNQALLQLDLQRPFQLAQLESQTRMPLIEAGINTAFGAPSTSLQGLGSANQNALQGAQFGLNRRQSNLGNAKAFGQGAGSLIGTGAKALGMCWIAEVLYGVDAPEVTAIRTWLRGPCQTYWLGRLATWLYVRYGEAVAATIRHRPVLQAPFRPLFDWALRRATT